jgi:group I intron endonuclease
MQKYCIYKHTCIVNGKSYIGQTCQKPTKRWETNGKGYEDQPVFWSAIQKYSWDNFDHEILEEGLTLQQANEREKYWIKYYHTYVNDPDSCGYNVTRGGDGGDSARCDYVRAKLRAKAVKRKVICIETQQVFNSVNDACQINKHVANCLNGKRPTASGYHWAYLEDTQRQLELKDYIGKPPKSFKDAGLSKRARAVICIDTGEEFETIQKAVKAYGQSVRAALDGKCTFAYGYRWCFKNEYKGN